VATSLLLVLALVFEATTHVTNLVLNVRKADQCDLSSFGCLPNVPWSLTAT
jgi:hypothetical protein